MRVQNGPDPILRMNEDPVPCHDDDRLKDIPYGFELAASGLEL